MNPQRDKVTIGSAGQPNPAQWSRIRISQIEDLRDAVLGAGLDAMQMSRAPVTGSLLFTEVDGIVYSSGSIDSRVALRGPLSEDNITLGLGLRIGSGTQHWFEEIDTGSIGVFLPGDEHDALYMPGSLYATATLDWDRLEAKAADSDLVLDRRTLGGTGIRRRMAADGIVAPIRRQLENFHCDVKSPHPSDLHLGESILQVAIAHLARAPHSTVYRQAPDQLARIVSRARDYIEAHLEYPIIVDEIASAIGTSKRSLFRAFSEILGETPGSYVRKLRLHRIRYDLSTAAERAVTVAMIAHRWGIGEQGRLAGWYREHFGELPSATLARHSPPPTAIGLSL